MCQVSAEKCVSLVNTHCGCECGCAIMLPIEDEIRSLEDHKKIFQYRIEMIDKKIASLKTVNKP